MPNKVRPIETAIVVDDDPILIALAQAHLEGEGIVVVGTASNGAEAMALLSTATTKVDLIICDLQMPGIDGLALLRLLRESDCQAAIIILSSMAEAVLALAKSLGESHGLDIRGALRKPLRAKELRALIAMPSKRRQVERPDQAGPTHEELSAALEAGQITAYFQPKISTADGKAHSAEALARWIDPAAGIVPPYLFIPLAERSGLATALTKVVLKIALDTACALRRLEPDFRISVNASAEVLSNLSVVQTVEESLRDFQLPASALIIEVTESQRLLPTPELLEVLGRLRLLGVDLSIDDFGTGHSNLEALRRFPFTELKIDQQFIMDALVDHRAAASARSCVSLAKDLGLHVVAEGIETAETLAFATDLGVHEMQGFYYAKPMPRDTLLTWIGARNKTATTS